MKIVIACTSAGAGHLKAAEALCTYFQGRNPAGEVILVDVLEESQFFFGNFYSLGYSFLINHAQWLWRFFFHITSKKNLQPALTKVRTLNNRLNTRNFRQYLIQSNPEIIISTHYLAANIASNLKKKKKITSRLVTVITDFGVHPFWIYKRTDLYAVASDYSRAELLKYGVSGDKVRVTGIPIDPKFYDVYDKLAMRAKLDLGQHKFTVLVITGSFGIGPIEQIVGLLRGYVQILVVCAKNEKLFIRLTKKNYPGVKVFGFVDNIGELMAASDLIVTKPGGLSISELLAMRLVPVFISAIPGQEAQNVKVLAQYGIGDKADNAVQVKKIVLNYFNSPQKLKSTQERMEKMRKPNAAEEIYRALC
ncbi:MAG: glycosyltransferase [Candidatus Omnitrophota bacterium]